MRRNHEFAKMMEAVAGLDYSNPKTKRHLVWFFSLQVVSVMFFNDMKEKNWFPFKTRRQIKRRVKEINPELWKMISTKNILHPTFVGVVPVIVAPIWRIAQIGVKFFRP
jgi:hypothetical protein